MNSTLLTVLAIPLMVFSVVNYFVYTQKRKKDQQGDDGYKTVFGVALTLLVIPIIFQAI